MKNFKRFFQVYIRPMWFRMLVVVLMAGITSSYSFVLGYIAKITVDKVLQLRPGGEMKVSDLGLGRDGSKTGLRDGANKKSDWSVPLRDPQRLVPKSSHLKTNSPKKTKTQQIYWLWVIFFSYLGIRLTFSVMNWFYTYNISFIGQRIVFHVRKDLHEKVQKLQMTFFDRQQTGKIMSRILDDVGTLQNEVTSTFVETVRNVTRIMIGVCVLIAINPKLGFLTLLTMPFYAVTYRVFMRVISVTSLKWREAYAETYGIMEERVKGIRVILSFAKEKGELRGFFKRVAKTFRLSIRRSMWNSGLSATCTFVSAVATALVLYWGTILVRSGEMTVGDLVFYNMSLAHLFFPLISLANINAVLQEMLVIISRVFEVMDEEILIHDRSNSFRLKHIQGRVTFRSVWFHYTENSDYILKNLEFEVGPGTSVAVVGPSGSGKSTLVSLLMRLYEPTKGLILIDDYEIRNVMLSSLRIHISMVPQEPILFSGTIADNIAYGRNFATPHQIVEAAKASEMHEFIMGLPEKYEAHVGERGANLSGGQKQRLAFAMALLTDPSILILDDTTSALDAKTEAQIQDTLDRVMRGRTTFVITHRISTAMRSDQILVLDHGRMVGYGKHEELIHQGGIYQKIYEQQKMGDDTNIIEPLDQETLEVI